MYCFQLVLLPPSGQKSSNVVLKWISLNSVLAFHIWGIRSLISPVGSSCIGTMLATNVGMKCLPPYLFLSLPECTILFQFGQNCVHQKLWKTVFFSDRRHSIVEVIQQFLKGFISQDVAEFWQPKTCSADVHNKWSYKIFTWQQPVMFHWFWTTGHLSNNCNTLVFSFKKWIYQEYRQ